MKQLVLWLVLALSLCAQTKPVFESATIKRSPLEQGQQAQGLVKLLKGQIVINRATLAKLIEVAYQTGPFDVVDSEGKRWNEEPKDSSTPPWIYHVEGQFDECTSYNNIHQMLQNLLVERLGLKCHRETKTTVESPDTLGLGVAVKHHLRDVVVVDGVSRDIAER